jgi:metallo-beta-lactamase class B
MHRVLIIILACLIQFQVFSRQAFKKIPVSKDIELIQLSENAYVHVSWANFGKFGRVSCNGLIYIQNGKAFLFDTPANDPMTKELVTYLRDSLKLTIKGFVPNHWHSDCMGGLAYLQSQKIESYASQKTKELAKSNQLPVPAHGF